MKILIVIVDWHNKNFIELSLHGIIICWCRDNFMMLSYLNTLLRFQPPVVVVAWHPKHLSKVRVQLLVAKAKAFVVEATHPIDDGIQRLVVHKTMLKNEKKI